MPARPALRTAALVAAAALLAASALLPSTARAASVQYSFTGTFTQGEDLYYDLFATFPPGTPFSGTFTVDLSAADTLPDPTYGNYENAVTAATMTIGSTVMDTSWNNRSDSILLRMDYFTWSDQTFLSIDFHAVRLDLDLSGLGITDVSIPTNLNLDAATLAGRNTWGMFQRDKYDFIEGRLTSFTSTLLVPTPAAACAALPLLALTGLLAAKRRRAS